MDLKDQWSMITPVTEADLQYPIYRTVGYCMRKNSSASCLLFCVGKVVLLNSTSLEEKRGRDEHGQGRVCLENAWTRRLHNPWWQVWGHLGSDVSPNVP